MINKYYHAIYSPNKKINKTVSHWFANTTQRETQADLWAVNAHRVLAISICSGARRKHAAVSVSGVLVAEMLRRDWTR